MDISRAEGDFLELHTTVVSPFLLVLEIERIIRVRAEAKGLKLEIRYHFPLPEKIFVDATRLKQILLNLLGNALKFTLRGGVKLDLHFDATENRLFFDVIDSGIGIPDHLRINLFSMFKRGSNHESKGYGLGLYLSQRLARLMNSKIKLVKTGSEGTTFSISVPVRSKESQIIRMVDKLPPINLEDDSRAKRLPLQSFSGNVLLIDDAPDTRKLIYLIVKGTGLNVLTAINGKEALGLMRENEIDIVITDIHMPLMDGHQTIRAIRESGFKGSIIATSADTASNSIRKALMQGANDFLGKPFKSDDIFRMLARYLPTNKRTAYPNSDTNLVSPANGLTESEDGEQLLLEFFEITSSRKGELESAIENGDLKIIKALIHQIKSAGAFGFWGMVEKAKSAEKALEFNGLASANAEKALFELIIQIEKELSRKETMLPRLAV